MENKAHALAAGFFVLLMAALAAGHHEEAVRLRTRRDGEAFRRAEARRLHARQVGVARQRLVRHVEKPCKERG